MPVQHRRASLYVSPCIYLVVSLKCILTTSMRRRNGRCTPKLQHKTPLSAPLSPVIWALIYVLFWQRLTSFLAASLHACTLGENNKSLGLPSRRAPWRVACVRRSSPLPCVPHLSSNLYALLISPYPSSPTYPLPVSDCDDKRRCAQVLGTGESHPFCVCDMCMCARGSCCLLWWQGTICTQHSLMHSTSPKLVTRPRTE